MQTGENAHCFPVLWKKKTLAMIIFVLEDMTKKACVTFYGRRLNHGNVSLKHQMPSSL